MGQAVTVANASGDKIYVRIQSSLQVSGKTDVSLSDSIPSAAGEATGKVEVEVRMLRII